MAAWQIAEAEISNANADETFHFEPERVEHSTDLAVDALTQNDAQPRGRKRMEPLNPRALTVEKNSARQLLRERWVPRPIERDFVFLVDLVTRVCEPLGEGAVVGEKEQTFGLRVEPANVEES